MIRFKVHDTLDERRVAILEAFVEGSVLPGLAVSCEDGVLLVGLKNDPKVLKIRRVFDRSAFLGVGAINDCEKLYDFAAAQAKIQARVVFSPGDPRIIADILKVLSESVRSNFRNLFNYEFLECEMLLVELGFEKQEDRLYKIDCTGNLTTGNNAVIVPQNHRFSIETLSKLTKQEGGLTMREAFRQVVRASEQLDNKVCFEAAILSRNLAQKTEKRNFDRIYCKLSVQEVEDWKSN